MRNHKRTGRSRYAVVANEVFTAKLSVCRYLYRRVRATSINSYMVYRISIE
ncbi:hypothetical protein KCP73_03140 [Salmonella enterica subsp. enterica]|nr:hypothetical protein KCP73_03140 [Salmonella enterica subsp. enterica]